MTPGGRLCRIRSGLWRDARFTPLSKGEQLVALYLLTGPPTNSFGLYRLSPGTACDELQLTKAVWWKRFRTVLLRLGWYYDERACVVWIPGMFAENPPGNLKGVRAWREAFDEVPDCELKTLALTTIRNFLDTKPAAYRTPFAEPVAVIKPQRRAHTSASIAPGTTTVM